MISNVTPEVCDDCCVEKPTRKIFMDGDSFGNDYTYLCNSCAKIHFEKIKEEEEIN